MDRTRAERATNPGLGSAAEPLAHRSGSPAGAKRANARQHDLAISRPDCPLQHRTGPLHEGTSLPRGAVHRHSLGLYVSRLPCTAPPGLLARARPRHREVRVARFARLRSVLASPHLARSDRQRQRPLGGRMEPARKEASDMGSAIGKRASPARLHQAGRRLANRHHAARTTAVESLACKKRRFCATAAVPLTAGSFPSAAPGPRPVARAPDSRCGRPVHRVRWPAPGRRYPAHCG